MKKNIKTQLLLLVCYLLSYSLQAMKEVRLNIAHDENIENWQMKEYTEKFRFVSKRIKRLIPAIQKIENFNEADCGYELFTLIHHFSFEQLSFMENLLKKVELQPSKFELTKDENMIFGSLPYKTQEHLLHAYPKIVAAPYVELLLKLNNEKD